MVEDMQGEVARFCVCPMSVTFVWTCSQLTDRNTWSFYVDFTFLFHYITVNVWSFF